MNPISDPVGIPEIDLALAGVQPDITDYVRASSAYVRLQLGLDGSTKKKAQLRLSHILGLALGTELSHRIPDFTPVVGEADVGGGLRTVQADVSEVHGIDGLRLAVEIKPVHLAVGRAIWNRFGDIRTFAVNIHLKFPFAVVGGVLSIPTYEESTGDTGIVARRSTTHLIARAVGRLARAGDRRNEGDAPHLLEAIGVVVFDPDTAILDPHLPAPGSGLRWSEFVDRLVAAFTSRFE